MMKYTNLRRIIKVKQSILYNYRRVKNFSKEYLLKKGGDDTEIFIKDIEVGLQSESFDGLAMVIGATSAEVDRIDKGLLAGEQEIPDDAKFLEHMTKTKNTWCASRRNELLKNFKEALSSNTLYLRHYLTELRAEALALYISMKQNNLSFG